MIFPVEVPILTNPPATKIPLNGAALVDPVAIPLIEIPAMVLPCTLVVSKFPTLKKIGITGEFIDNVYNPVPELLAKPMVLLSNWK